MEKKIITVEILGQECKIVASTPEEEARIQKIAQLIQSEIQSTLERTGASQVTALLYTALNLGDRLFRELESTENLREQITESADRIAKLEKMISQKGKEPRKTKGKKAKEEIKEDPDFVAEAVEESIPEIVENPVENSENPPVETAEAVSFPLMEDQETRSREEETASEPQSEGEEFPEEQTKLPNC
ncbi:MAG: cell division protein ZapA [Eubacteriales bacterium]